MTQRWRKLGVIFPQRDADVWNQRPSAPCVFRTDDRYLMYLHGLQFFSEQRKLTRIGLAEAPLDDPLDWRMVSEEPLIDLGGEGATDSHMAAYPWVVRITDTHWHLYYAAWDGSFLPHAPHQKRYQTCMAESDDAGVTWRRDGRPLLALGRSGAPDENGTGSCAVIPVGDEYWMYYTALSVPTADWGRISTALAVSRDGGHTFVPHAAGALLNLHPASATSPPPAPSRSWSAPATSSTCGSAAPSTASTTASTTRRAPTASTSSGSPTRWST